MTPPTISSPDVLARVPELAVLDVLDVALTAAHHALFAANPELESSEYLLETPQPSVAACLADAVLDHINALQAAVERYRQYTNERKEILGGSDSF